MSGKITLKANGNVLVFLVTPWFTVSLSTVVPYISSAEIDMRRRSPARAAKTSSAFTADTSVPKRTLVIDLERLTFFCKKFLGDALFRFSLWDNTQHGTLHFTNHSPYGPREFVLSFPRVTV